MASGTSANPNGRTGTPWAIRNHDGNGNPYAFQRPTDDVFEITFQGSVHDQEVGVTLKASALTLGGPAPVPLSLRKPPPTRAHSQHDASIAMESNGTFVDGLHAGQSLHRPLPCLLRFLFGLYSQTIEVRTFDGGAIGGPIVAALETNAGSQVLPNQIISSPNGGVPSLVLDFDKPLYASATLTRNWRRWA